MSALMGVRYGWVEEFRAYIAVIPFPGLDAFGVHDRGVDRHGLGDLCKVLVRGTVERGEKKMEDVTQPVDASSRPWCLSTFIRVGEVLIAFRLLQRLPISGDHERAY